MSIDEKLQRLKEKMPADLWLSIKGSAHRQGMTIMQWIINAAKHELEKENHV